MNTLAPRMQRASGESRVAFAVRDGETRLTDLYQRDPCRILFPDPEPGEPPQAVLVTTSGGIAGGDVLKMAVEVGPGGQAVVATQAAEKIYRAAQSERSLHHRRGARRGRGRDARLAAAGDHRLRRRAAQAPHGGATWARADRCSPARWSCWAAPPRASASRAGCCSTPGRCAVPASSPGPTRCGSRARRRWARVSVPANALATVIGVWDEPQPRFEKARGLLEGCRQGAGGRHPGEWRDGGTPAGRGHRGAGCGDRLSDGVSGAAVAARLAYLMLRSYS